MWPKIRMSFISVTLYITVVVVWQSYNSSVSWFNFSQRSTRFSVGSEYSFITPWSSEMHWGQVNTKAVFSLKLHISDIVSSYRNFRDFFSRNPRHDTTNVPWEIVGSLLNPFSFHSWHFISAGSPVSSVSCLLRAYSSRIGLRERTC